MAAGDAVHHEQPDGAAATTAGEYQRSCKPGSLGGHEIVAPLVAEKIVRSVAGAAEDRDMSEIEAVPPLLALYPERLNQRRLDHGQKSIRPARWKASWMRFSTSSSTNASRSSIR